MNLDIVNWFVVFVRVGAVLMVFPLTGSANVPVRLRIALAGLTAFLMSANLPPPPVGTESFWNLVLLLFKETCSGLLLGFVARLVFFGLEISAAILTTEMGLTLSPIFNPVNQTQVTAPGAIFNWMALMIFLALDLHHWLLVAIQRSYVFLPVGGAKMSEAVLVDVLGRVSHLFVFALQVAAPVMAVSFSVTLIFSVLARAVPQMNVFSESFPFRVMSCLIVFGLSLNLMAQHLLNELKRLPEAFLRVAQLLGGG